MTDHSHQISLENNLAASASQCVEHAAEYAYDCMKEDGHWCLEIRSSITFTIQWLCVRQILGPPLTSEEVFKFQHWLLSQQNPEDGSWGLAPGVHNWAGDVSTTTEAYFGLKLLGTPVNDKAMCRARAFVLAHGGVAQVGVLTQLALALFGIIAWKDMAQVPAELMALPTGLVPIDIYSFSYWSRVSAVAIMLLRHHQPVYTLHPYGDEEVHGATFLDELFVNPIDRSLKLVPSLSTMWRNGQIGRICCTIIDKAAGLVEPALRRSFVRSYSLSACATYIIDHLDEGGYGSLTVSNFLGIIALHSHGCQASHPVIQHLQKSMGVALWEDCTGLRMQVTVGPVWDTALMTLGLLETGLADDRTARSIEWFKNRQVLNVQGDYRVRNPAAILPGGWSFQYSNEYFPDNDDTLVCILAIVMRDPQEMASPCILRGLNWLLAMQCSDGGWAVYDTDNDNHIANLFPFADSVEFFDDSVPDVTGRVLEVLGYILTHPLSAKLVRDSLRQQMFSACQRGLAFLGRTQEKETGSWRSRWHVNYLNGTSSVLCALPYFQPQEYAEAGICVSTPIAWLRSVQNPDGGWGESLDSYKEKACAGRGLVSTPSQTAWAVMALLALLPPTDASIERGVRYLLDTQKADAVGVSWEQEAYVSVGFPNTLWLDFGSQRHGYPMIALGRYLHACRQLKDARPVGQN